MCVHTHVCICVGVPTETRKVHQSLKLELKAIVNSSMYVLETKLQFSASS